MKDARKRELDTVADAYNGVFNEFKENTANDNEVDKEQLKQLEKLRDLYKHTRSMPVWPYDLELFIKFGVIFLTNLLVYFSQYLFGLLK